VALTEPDWAVIVALPADWPVAVPETLTVATLVSDEDQVELPMSEYVLPSENVPTALYPSVAAGASMALPGLRVIETSVAELTFNVAEPVTLPNAAVMFAVPAATPVAVITDLPLLFSVATVVSLDVHWQLAVMS
jgi:hypothetical protein